MSSNPLKKGVGLLWVVPALSASPEDVEAVERVLTESFHRYGFDVPITLTFINERTLICTSNISFNRHDPSDVQAARDCYREVIPRLIRAGFPPYRSGIGGYDGLDQGGSHWEIARRLKAIFDPDNIIGPGRYFR